MKILRTLIAAAILATVATSGAQAQNRNTVFFKAPAIAGSGCPAGTTDYAITPDGSTLTILFDAFNAETRRPQSCNIAVPVHVPNGYQVSLLTADYRGFVEGRAELRRSYFFAGATGPRLVTPLSGPGGKDYTQRDNLITSSNSYARCGQDVNLRINSSIRTKASRSFISVDSLDLQNGVVFHLKYRRC